MKIGIFGGSFNPVHNGHLQVAESAKKQFALDRVLFIPAAIPPHKQKEKLLSDQARLEMLKLALQGKKDFSIDECELQRKGVSYTIDTVRDLKSRYPDTQFFLILGSDSLPIFPKWKEIHLLLKEVQPIVYPRKGFTDLSKLALSPALSLEEIQKIQSGFLSLPNVDISATEIREKIHRRENVEALVPKPVAEYIQTHELGI